MATRRAAEHGGFFTYEVALSVTLTGTLLAVLAGVVLQYANARRYYLTQRTVQLAAEGQMERYRAGLPADAPPPIDGIPPKVRIRTEAVAGEGLYAGLQRLTVTAEADLRRGRIVTARVVGYVPVRAGPAARATEDAR